MNPIEEPFAQQAQQACAQGRYIAGLASRMEYLRQRAKGFLSALDISVTWIDKPPGASFTLAEEYEAEGDALARQVAELGDDAPVELVAVKNIYLSLSNLLSEMSIPGPVDGERLAKVILHGMDLAHLSNFCSRIDAIPEEIERENAASRADASMKGSSTGGKNSGHARREKAAAGWHAHALELAKTARKQDPDLSQDRVVEEIQFGWKAEKKAPGARTLKAFVSRKEKVGELPPRIRK